jgi:hypothetical protein
MHAVVSTLSGRIGASLVAEQVTKAGERPGRFLGALTDGREPAAGAGFRWLWCLPGPTVTVGP